MEKKFYSIFSILLGLVGIGLSFLSLIVWYLGFIGLGIGIVALVFSTCLNADNRNKKISFYVSIASIISSLMIVANYICKEFISVSFVHNGKTYMYNNAALSLILFVIMIGIFVWDKLPMATTAILGCSLMVVFNLCSFSTAFGQFASSTVVLTIGVMIIGAAISETGLARVIGKWIIKISKGSERKLIVGTYIVSALMSAFLTNSAVLAIFIPIIVGLSKTDNKIKAKNLIMPIAIGCVLGGASTLVGSTQQMTAQGLLEEAGLKTFKTFDFLPIVGIILLIGLLYILLFAYKKGQKMWSDEDISDEVIREENDPKKPIWKMVVVACIFVFAVVFYITEWLPLAITSTVSAIACIITGCITQKKAINSVNWNIVGRLAGCLGLAKGLEFAGGTALISQGFMSIFGESTNPFLLFAVLVLLVLLTSQFISNSTAILIVLPIVISIAPNLGLNTYAYAMGITIASGVALSSPLASSTLGMSMVVGYKFKDYFKYSFFLDVLSYLIILITIPLFFGLTV